MDSAFSRLADYEISADPDRLDAERIHLLVSEHTAWGAGRERATQDAILRNSRNYGAYERSTGLQVAYCRVVTDQVTFGWLADVIVDPAHRGRGIGRALIDGVLEDLAPLNLRRIVLKASEEARPMYERAGWTGPQDPELWMERRQG
ncbi:GCN5 family acetyltransferase [Brachybacterium phenoliresistens]|uniref:GCN5 family acetyltransferase n=1 Tax=Brachybacterium phenoliresistens TaxID=396014 RepID=Z9JVM5_9MICO|nr:GNAT family N-acetyltransferase [Brachybacterium phenoliresistens]EWS82430.1 GCN5 family acetyltransferase [Brachybacterium phenoliresistens]